MVGVSNETTQEWSVRKGTLIGYVEEIAEVTTEAVDENGDSPPGLSLAIWEIASHMGKIPSVDRDLEGAHPQYIGRPVALEGTTRVGAGLKTADVRYVPAWTVSHEGEALEVETIEEVPPEPAVPCSPLVGFGVR